MSHTKRPKTRIPRVAVALHERQVKRIAAATRWPLAAGDLSSICTLPRENTKSVFKRVKRSISYSFTVECRGSGDREEEEEISFEVSSFHSFGGPAILSIMLGVSSVGGAVEGRPLLLLLLQFD